MALAAAMLVLTGALLAQQADRNRTEALARRANDRLQALQQEAERLASDERTRLGDLRKLEIEREIRTEELRDIVSKGIAAASELTGVDEQFHRIEREEVDQRPELRARVVDLYKLGQGRYLRLLLSMSDVRSVGQASRLVAALAKSDHDRIDAHERRLEELNEARATLEARGKTLASLRVEAERARTAADRAVTARNELIRNIDNARDLNAELAGELKGAQQKLQITLSQVGGGETRAGSTALPFRPFRGDLDWPVAGTVRQRFGRADGAGHLSPNGIEIAAEEGAPVTAIHEGTVAFAAPFAGFGNLIIVQHDARSFSLYGNLADLAVARGASIEKGQQIGSVGLSLLGRPGLYFELRVDDRPVDPLQWLRKR